jgi:hypothetical protein
MWKARGSRSADWNNVGVPTPIPPALWPWYQSIAWTSAEPPGTVPSISDRGVPTTTPSGVLGSEVMNRSAYRGGEWEEGQRKEPYIGTHQGLPSTNTATIMKHDALFPF